jgi:hypothetical protein
VNAQQWANYVASLPKSDEERLADRVAQLVGGIGMRSVAEAERMAARELNLRHLIEESTC